ncbi:MAG: hypothetical protein ACRCSZ_11130 [Lactococcus lactis]
MICSSYTFADQPDVFSNPTTGIQVTKPAEWKYSTVQQHKDNINKLKITDKEFHAAMQKYSTAPLVSMMKFAEPYEDINPSFKIILKPYGQLKGKQTAELLNLSISQFKKVVRDFELVQPAIEVDISGIKSAYARMNYTMEIPDGRSFPTTSELWIVPHGDYFFLIGAGTRQDEKTGSRAEINSILQTIKIEQ